MPNDATYAPNSNYEQMGGTIWVVGGQLVFDATTAIKLTASSGKLVTTAIPTTDPQVVGALYADSVTHVLKLSAGP